MANPLGNHKGFVSLIGMLLTLGIICYLVYILLNRYLQPQTLVINATSQGFQGSNIDTSSYISIKDSVKQRVEEFNKESLKRSKQIEEAIK